ncbi:MAG TPA: pyruvate kinase [Vicinamibacterales bacterium]|nr:pyruvate kinase [Vicinamibacterales bacterium]
MRRTKIIATLGPASASDTVLRELVAGGVDVFRLNFSHGTHEGHAAVIEKVRRIASEAGRIVALLQDLSGPKIRIGKLRGGGPVTLKEGETLSIVVGDIEGDAQRVSTTYADLPKGVHAGDTLLLDDGKLELRVKKVAGDEIETIVVEGGPLGEHKGINVPSVELPTTGLTAKDIDDLHFGVRAGVDYVALSFVQNAAVLRQAREEIQKAGGPAIPLIAKLERPEAIARLEEILGASDAVMVARGDLGLELPLERVPRIQKDVTRWARALHVPVIVATQVLESMRTEPRPTRAEVSDAANAVDDGVDAIMLSGETAAGAYPVRAVHTLDLVICEAESMPSSRVQLERPRLQSGHQHAVCEAAVTLAERGDAAAIVAITRGGTTARVLSALRTRVPIFAATDQPEIARRLALPWGVVPVLTEIGEDVATTGKRISDDLLARHTLQPGAVVVFVSVSEELGPGPTNFVKLQKI